MALAYTGNSQEILGGSVFSKLKSGLKKVAKVYTAPARFAVKKVKGKKFSLFGAQTWEDVLMGFSGTTWEDAALMCGIDISEPETMGKFLPGLTKVIKKIGKITSPITTKLAKTFLPSSIVDAAAKLDPTGKGNVVPQAVAAVKTLVAAKQEEAPSLLPAQTTPGALQKTAIMNTLKNPLVIGVVAVGAGIVLLMVMKKRR